MEKSDHILFTDIHTKKDLEIINEYPNKTILYQSKELFFKNLNVINQILRKKTKVFSFDADIIRHINNVKKKKIEKVGVLSKVDAPFINELRKVYDVDLSDDCKYFLNKDIPLFIVDIENTKEYNNLLIIQKKYIINSNNSNIFYNIYNNIFWDKNVNFMNIYNNCIISDNLDIIKSSIYKKYNLNSNYDIEKPIIYIGCYSDADFNKIIEHKSIVFLIWMNTDCNDENKRIMKRINILKNKKNIVHIASTESISNILKKYNIHPILFNINLVNNSIFTPIEKRGDKIFIYNSNFTDTNLHKQIVEQLPQYDFIYNNKFDVNNADIVNIYKKCFIVLRLTKFDGYTSMVNELNEMNIPIIHNFSDSGLKWENIEDIKKHILDNSPPIIRYNHQYSFDLFNNNFTNNDLEMIYNNLDEFKELIDKYKKILFVCNGHPTLDESGINGNNILNFIKEDDKTIIPIFLTDGIFNNIDYLKNLNFIPDLVIVKGDCNFDFKKHYKVSTIFLASDLYYNNLDRYYWDNKSYKYINNNIINKINTFDISFIPSNHINSILKKYKLSCKLFYWSFIPYYRKYLNNFDSFDNREYEYGIIIDDKNKNIKNSDKLLKFINNKKSIIEKYSNSEQYYRKIKYVLLDSFYESSCRVKIDALMNGCKLNITQIIYFERKIIYLKKGFDYIIQFNGCVLTDKPNYGINFIEGSHDKEIIIYYYAENDLEIELHDFIKTLKINYNIIGYNPVILKETDLEYLYYLYGSLNIQNYSLLEYIGLKNIYYYYDNYTCDLYNIDLLKRKWIYDLGLKGEKLDLELFSDFILENNSKIISKKCLFLSKKIKGYGGNQKTAIQLINLLEKYFIVEVLSNNMNNNNYNMIVDSLDYTIHNMKIIKKKKENEIIEYINNNNYELIINNKFDEYFTIATKIKKKMIAISHNSMDNFNNLIIDNQNCIEKVLTINKFHQEVLFKHGLKLPVGNIYNTVEKEEYEEKRDKFKKRICFIGRLSKEKNINLLLDSFKLLKLDLELVIIGGGTTEMKMIKNVIWKGILTKDEIICELRKCDYLVLSSYTEGLPFVILEAMNIGIPCIYSDINGANEIMNGHGFTFTLDGYEECKMRIDWSVYEEVDKYYEKNIKNLYDCINNAYNISIEEWNRLSMNCKRFIRKKYWEEETTRRNKSVLGIK